MLAHGAPGTLDARSPASAQALLLHKCFWICQSHDTFSVSSKVQGHTLMQRRSKPALSCFALITSISGLGLKYLTAIAYRP